MAGCGGEAEPAPDVPDDPGSDSVVVAPATPLEVALQFSDLLGRNDPRCYDMLVPHLRDSLVASGVLPRDVFGRWRGFDAGGRLSETYTDSTGVNRTTYDCSITRTELPVIVRIDFRLVDGHWRIEGFGEEVPQTVADSLTVEHLAGLVLENPGVREELRIARMLYEDCRVDSMRSYASWNAASDAGEDFASYVSELDYDSYNRLAYSNIRRSAKFQIIQERATYELDNVPLDLHGFVAAWRELGYLSKAVLRTRHESMQDLRQTGEYTEPDLGEEAERLAMLRNYFLSVSNIVEETDTLSRTYPVLLTEGDREPLNELQLDLDPHVLEQRRENDVGTAVWRALGVEMNGDRNPERVVYWAGDLYVFEGRESGYRLVWRSYLGYDSDYHASFASEPADSAAGRDVTLVGNDYEYEYRLGYRGGQPVMTRTALATEEEMEAPPSDSTAP
jgi:hypothetical protein